MAYIEHYLCGVITNHSKRIDYENKLSGHQWSDNIFNLNLFVVSGCNCNTVFKSIDKAKEYIQFYHDVKHGKFKELVF